MADLPSGVTEEELVALFKDVSLVLSCNEMITDISVLVRKGSRGEDHRVVWCNSCYCRVFRAGELAKNLAEADLLMGYVG